MSKHSVLKQVCTSFRVWLEMVKNTVAVKDCPMSGNTDTYTRVWLSTLIAADSEENAATEATFMPEAWNCFSCQSHHVLLILCFTITKIKMAIRWLLIINFQPSVHFWSDIWLWTATHSSEMTDSDFQWRNVVTIVNPKWLKSAQVYCTMHNKMLLT